MFLVADYRAETRRHQKSCHPDVSVHGMKWYGFRSGGSSNDFWPPTCASNILFLSARSPILSYNYRYSNLTTEMTTCFGRQLAVASCIWQIRVRRRTYVYIATCDQYLSISRKQYKIWPIWLSKALILYDTDIIDIDIDIGNVSWPTSTQLNSTNHPKRRVD